MMRIVHGTQDFNAGLNGNPIVQTVNPVRDIDHAAARGGGRVDRLLQAGRHVPRFRLYAIIQRVKQLIRAGLVGFCAYGVSGAASAAALSAAS